ncbi:MAG: 50S ribosomal protein L10 [Bacteroidia bacterium]|nr:50S ribosomal protein L10 [Bacteroidia bacterium]
MKREDKNLIIDKIAEQLNKSSHFYLTDISDFTATQTSELRRKCFERDIKLMVVKNTLLREAMERTAGKYDELFQSLKGSTSVMFTEQGNTPAKLIKELRKKQQKPLLKAAWIQECFYIGDSHLDALVTLKSKNELIGEIVFLLQSPAGNVLSGLQSGGHILAGVLKTLSERES